MEDRFDVLAIGAHPDDVEAMMGGTVIKMTDDGLRVLIVDLSPGEPARHAAPGVRAEQALRAAECLGADRSTLSFQDRFIIDDIESRLTVARLIRLHRPRYVFTSLGSGIHPDHKAVTDIVTHAVFYARLPKWDQISGGDMLDGTEPHEIDRLFYGHCRMEPSWDRFDFAIDISDEIDRKMQALSIYDAVFSGDQRQLLERYGAEDRFVGSLLGVFAAEPFRARSPLLLDSPGMIRKVRFG